MAHLHALPVGHEFEGYRVERVLGAGGFGITYLATETMIGRLVAIKEYLPSSVAARAAGNLSVHPIVAADAEIYGWGLKRFRNEARTLVSFHHPNIVPVYRYFEANGTAYLVMQFQEGASLAQILKTARTLPEEEIREFLDPLLDGVAEVHKAGFLHRDIKPANIVILASGKPVLIDFGAARQALGAKSQSAHAIVSPGYAPFEQYTNASDQGPPTDIYALGATLYCCVSGTRPVEAPDRVAGAPMRPASEVARGRYSAALLEAIDHALALQPEDRPQSVAAWREELTAQPTRISEIAPAPAMSAAATATARPSRRAMQMGLIACLAGLVTVGGYEVVRSQMAAQAEEEAKKRAAAEEAKRRAQQEEEERLREAQEAEMEGRRRAEDAARQRAEAAAQKGREAQGRALAAERTASAARQHAVAAAECARGAAARARNRETGYYAGKLKNGNYYEGQLNQANYPHGCGVTTETDGARYEGQYQEGRWHGYGVRTKDGLRYEGGYKANQIDGYGTVIYKDKSEAHFTLIQGVVTGPGVWINPDGTRFEGDVVAERWSGYGVLRYTDGSVFQGEFAGGQVNGLGVHTYADGRKVHGRWEKGQYKGLA